ncbi:MAG: PAS domain-containing protein [Anaerolineales bacterium]|nr:PAS domain-containing protein [Anaerolineales bacterium]MBP6208299.1 PAS domain-containing protein [Anaerolineales bacterium]MBP8165185.1 PAS domain-containing protein [Anaerolineales bacterium]
MNNLYLPSLIFLILIAAWFAWRYYDLKRRLEKYTQQVRSQNLTTDIKGIENLSNAVASVQAAFNTERLELNTENARLSTVLEQLTDGVLIADENGLIQFANPAVRRLFDTSEVIGRSIAEVIRNHQLVDAWRRCQLTRELQSESVELPARRQFIQLIAIPDSHAGGSLLLAQDLTRVRRLETVRRDFISNVSHELRTPLASLKALTETLQNGALSDPAAGPRFLGRISTEVDALTQMAQELLDLSRIESGQVELNLAPLAPKSLISSAADRMKMQAERASLKLTVKCAENLPLIRADKLRLEQVLVNLIHNAVKFTKPGGEITLGAEPVTGGVRFAVRDSGIGIPTESLSRIFERFYRVEKSRTGSGTGLGLSISKHIIEAHGGMIWAESREGSGSIFYFVIPPS